MSDLFERVLIANRGEIASRILRTLTEEGIGSAAVYTDADAGARHVAAADVAVRIDNYLDGPAVVAAAVQVDADAVHPGYGFLSENPVFARLVLDAGLTWIGPPPAAIEAMGDKIRAKQTVSAAGVPVVPGSDRSALSDEELVAAAMAIGLPVLLKPSAGGGGKGMRRVSEPDALAEEIAAGRREARGAFGDDTLLVERLITRPRHIEVQVFADSYGRVIHLGERECSLQRRHQKIVEEAPSPLLDAGTRAAIGASAVDAAKSCGYVGAGTVEFIVSADRPHEFFFMEMNTRLQVEHPVTEMVTGIDLVAWQLRVAAGEPLPLSQEQVTVNGHAVEARVYAEDPARGFLPATGTVLALREAGDRPGVRVDSALAPGVVVGTEYDPMLAKVIAAAPDRSTALARLGDALDATAVLGVTTNVAFLQRLLADPDVVAGDLDTELVERFAASYQAGPDPRTLTAAALVLAERNRPSGDDPWDTGDGWRIGGRAETVFAVVAAGRPVALGVTGAPGDAVVRVDDSAPAAVAARFGADSVTVTTTAGTAAWLWAVDGDDLWIGRRGEAWRLTPDRSAIGETGALAARGGPVTSPMPGTVLAVHVDSGQHVRAGDPMVVVEAMKMEHTVVAPADGTVADVLVRAGQAVALDQTLAVMGTESDEQ